MNDSKYFMKIFTTNLHIFVYRLVSSCNPFKVTLGLTYKIYHYNFIAIGNNDDDDAYSITTTTHLKFVFVLVLATNHKSYLSTWNNNNNKPHFFNSLTIILRARTDSF